jgi:hypothetical protein
MKTPDLPGIVNGHIVDDKLLRGGDVDTLGISTCLQLKVVKIISLRNAKQDDPLAIRREQRRATEAGLTWLNIPMDSSGVFATMVA